MLSNDGLGKGDWARGGTFPGQLAHRRPTEPLRLARSACALVCPGHHWLAGARQGLGADSPHAHEPTWGALIP